MIKCPKGVRDLLKALAEAWGERFSEEDYTIVEVDGYEAVGWNPQDGNIIFFPANHPTNPTGSDKYHPTQYWVVTEDEVREMINHPDSIPVSLAGRPMLET